MAEAETIRYRIAGITSLQDGDSLSVQEVTPTTTGLPELNSGWEYRAFQISSDATSAFMSVVVEER